MVASHSQRPSAGSAPGAPTAPSGKHTTSVAAAAPGKWKAALPIAAAASGPGTTAARNLSATADSAPALRHGYAAVVRAASTTAGSMRMPGPIVDDVAIDLM